MRQNPAVGGYEQLLRYLDETDEQSAARRYMLLRAKLTMYFEGRKISPAEDFADEVLHRVVVKISSGEKIDDINRYVFGVARFVCLEHFRQPDMETIDTESGDVRMRTHAALKVEPKIDFENGDGTDVKHRCLRSCLAELSDEKRKLLIDYYAIDETRGKHKDQRRQLAISGNRSAGALQKEICLLRKKIGNCTKECVKENE
jgi:DNA-directed RNA polymerase specialized sigma24 family protein